jgi:hypothetical protein
MDSVLRKEGVLSFREGEAPAEPCSVWLGRSLALPKILRCTQDDKIVGLAHLLGIVPAKLKKVCNFARSFAVG